MSPRDTGDRSTALRQSAVAVERSLRVTADAEHVSGMQHRVVVTNREQVEALGPVLTSDVHEHATWSARAREHTFYSDEPPAIPGGRDEHPAPLEYLVAGVAT